MCLLFIFIGPRYIYPSVSKTNKQTLPLVNLTDVNLADEDTNSILTDNANRAIQDSMMQPGGQICNICKCRHLMANFGTNASGAT